MRGGNDKPRASVWSIECIIIFYFYFLFYFLFTFTVEKSNTLSTGVGEERTKERKNKQTRTKGGRVIQPDLVNGAHPMMPWVFVTCTGES